MPDSNTYLLKLPDNYVGKPVEVIAFEVDEKSTEEKSIAKKDALQKTLDFYNSIQIDLSDFKFNRDEANER